MQRLIAGLVVCLVLLALLAPRMFRIAAERRNCILGFHGERAVGEEINQLMRDGCRVFHDIPMEPYGNIDHVIVAPSGVYSIETKTHRKRKAPKGGRDHEVVFDGEALAFPHRRDKCDLEQAKRQSKQLCTMLTKAVGESVKVSPIVTLPGWYVSSRVNNGIKVLNPKQIKQVVLNVRDATLSPQLVERIAYQLDQKCRDVEL